MLENVPAWLGKALRNVRAGHGKLAIARLGGEGLLGRGGFAVSSPSLRRSNGPRRPRTRRSWC